MTALEVVCLAIVATGIAMLGAWALGASLLDGGDELRAARRRTRGRLLRRIGRASTPVWRAANRRTKRAR